MYTFQPTQNTAFHITSHHRKPQPFSVVCLNIVGGKKLKTLTLISSSKFIIYTKSYVNLAQTSSKIAMMKPDSIATSTKIKFEEESEDEVSSSEDEREREIERELAEVTFGELQKARSDGSDMVYRKFGSDKNGSGRANKNRPAEMTSKKPVSRFREVIQVPKKVVRDPRFETLCGNLDVEGFKKRYNFLYEDTLPAEKEELKKQLKKSKDPEVLDKLKTRISWIDKQLKSAVPKRTDKDILAEHKKKEKEAAKQGKQPYYLKKSEIRTQKLIEKYKELKETGKLESFIEKKRRKNASKDHKYMPYRRPNEGNQ